MNEDWKALNKIIEDAVRKENELQIRSDALAIQNKEFADYLRAKRIADEELEVLWDMAKEFMIENNITEHENDYIKLKLTPSGKYRATVDIDEIDDALCDIKKVVSNKKVKKYLEMAGELPENIESTGYILRKSLKNDG